MQIQAEPKKNPKELTQFDLLTVEMRGGRLEAMVASKHNESRKYMLGLAAVLERLNSKDGFGQNLQRLGLLCRKRERGMRLIGQMEM